MWRVLLIAALLPGAVAEPVFENLATPKITSIYENANADSLVFTLIVSDTKTPTSSLTISIKSQTPASPVMFKLVGNEVQVVNGDLDAEKNAAYELVFEVKDGTSMITVQSAVLTVNVNDLNDNAPLFSNVPPVTMSEDHGVGLTDVVVDIDATDADLTDPNNKLTYSIRSDSIFNIDSTNGEVTLAKKPQSMTLNTYTLPVSVEDGGTPKNSATIDVTVTIERNVDDCADSPCQNGGECVDGINLYTCNCQPGFKGTKCEENIDDCAQAPCQNGGECVDGVNSYTCNCQPGFAGTNCTENIDECADSPCQNGGECVDGINSYSCRCKLGFSGTNCTNNIPVFIVPDPDLTKDAHKIYMKESLQAGDTVITLRATDVENDDATLTFGMENSPIGTKDLFELVGADLKVKAGVPADTFDYEKPGGATLSYVIKLKVSDGASASSLHTKIYIQDENDNAPVFSGLSPYSHDVLDSTVAGTSVYKVEATDLDGTTENNKITYGMTGSTAFVINPSTGVISTAPGVTFDPQVTPQYQLTVTATDSGAIPKAKSEILRLNIVSAPVFDNLAAAQTTLIDENAIADSTVFTLTVSDKDTPTSSLIITIKNQNPASPVMFKVVGNEVKTQNGDLDAETLATYDLVFEVRDGVHKTTSEVLTVNINDLNDNTPTIAPVNPITIPENQGIGEAYVVVDIDATDEDISEPNNKVTFAITSGNAGDVFGINSTNGQIYLAQTPRSMTKNVYVLRVKVTDGGTPTKEDTVDVTVTIDDSIVEECPANICQNGGTCTSFVNGYSCACVLGYDGDNCQNNINDCIDSPCQNDRECVDGVNSYSCICLPGFVGPNCENACTNNTYGNGCSHACNCNTSRLIYDVGTQTCDHVTGACKCNTTQWTGDECTTDIDECMDSAICSAEENMVCENTPGSYYCTCKTGYSLELGGTCTKSLTLPSVAVGANERKISIITRLDKTCVAWQIPSVFKGEQTALEAMMSGKLRSLRRILVNSIVCGSEIFTSEVVIDDTEPSAARLAKDLQAMRDGETLNVDGVNTKVEEMTVESNTISTSTPDDKGTKICAIYATYITCPDGQECRYENGWPSCRDMDDDGALDLILGLSLGLGIPLLLTIALGIFFCCYRFVRDRDEEYDTVSNTSKMYITPSPMTYLYMKEPTREYMKEPTREYMKEPTRGYMKEPTRGYMKEPAREYPEYIGHPDKRDFYGLPPIENGYQTY